MVELPLVTQPMTDAELDEATRKELVFFMEESTRYRNELTAAKAEVERLQGELVVWLFRYGDVKVSPKPTPFSDMVPNPPASRRHKPGP